MRPLTINGHTIVFYKNPCEYLKIKWSDLLYPAEETVQFEPDGDGISKYVYAQRVKDGKFLKIGKAIKNMMIMPFLLGFSQVMVYLTLLYNHLDTYSNVVSAYCIILMYILILYTILIHNSKEELSCIIKNTKM